MAEISYISAQMTITDLTDGTTLVTRMSDNKNYGGSFFYDSALAAGSQYTPDWPAAVSNGNALILSPVIHTTTSSDNLFKGSHVDASTIKYFEHHPLHEGGKKEIPTGGVAELFEFTSGNKYKIRLGNRWENTTTGWPKLTGNQIVYSVSFKYKDPIFAEADSTFTGVDMSIEYVINRFESGKGATYITINTTPGDVFVNADSNATIKLTAIVSNEGSIEETFTQDNSVWQYFDDAEGIFKPVTAGVNPSKKNELSVTQDQIDGSEIFKFKWTPDGKLWYEAVKTIVDYSDPYMITMNSLNGDVFKEGQGIDKTIAVRVYKTTSVGSQVELLGPTELAPFTAKIRRYSKDGTEIPNEPAGPWKTIVGSSVSNSKPMEFSVTPNDVTVYCTFIASVEFQKPAKTRKF